MASQDDYSDIQQEVPLSEEYEKDPDSIARGHKATIANPNTSEQAKEHSRKVLENEFQEPYDKPNRSQDDRPEPHQKDPGNVARGLKASISNPGVSEEAKEHARDKLNKLQ
ncbi:hypothetical protein SODALDRAFT_347938 [Sodiomyces alkalinus F11]|uniref:Conidiation-specific protein 6 n=1 Tax=Sodiomyces alkalinus (strain CBS 110278 / VKM F-3762 / F11) TaxID=1314773 RepID=A0A3N2Q8S8_SODAK|nr:hypothetical protein SODALDRAFT_347938 [Sodiomyces alkalinus F11]ROT43140.1 hypothetical protein SODALDRAFT_347938 [Sodiomyces alkalinus F11]